MNRSGEDEFAKRLMALEREIMSYLLQHPNAKDTAEGIAQWWLPRTYSGLRAGALADALEDLQKRGWIKGPARADGSVVYGLEFDKRDEVAKWLEN